MAREFREPSGQEFTVRVSDIDMVYQFTQRLARREPIKDSKLPAGKGWLSRTNFNIHDILSGEVTRISTERPGKYYADVFGFSLNSTLFLTPRYVNRAHQGYINSDKTEQIGEEMAKDNKFQVEIDYPGLIVGYRTDRNAIRIIDNEFEVTIDLGVESKETEMTSDIRRAEVEREAIDPEGGLNDAYMEQVVEPTLKKMPPDDEEARRKAIEALYMPFTPRRDTYEHNAITLQLSKRESSAKDLASLSKQALFQALGGIAPLTSVEDFRRALDIYTRAYASFVTAFCHVEGTVLPQEPIILGSSINTQ